MHERIGERRLSNRFGWMQVVKWEGNKKVTVKFDEHPNEVVCQWVSFNSGLVTAYPHADALTFEELKAKVVGLDIDGIVTSRTSKVECTCRVCGNRSIKSGNSLLSQPYCTNCANNNVVQAELNHTDDSYTYTEYKGLDTILKFKCKVHGYYQKTLRKAKKNINCPTCSREAVSTSLLKDKLNLIVDNILYTIPNTVNEKVKTSCNKCNAEYFANVTTLLKVGRGCEKCRYLNVKQRVTFETFKERAKDIEGYEYDKSSWKSIYDNLDITHLDCGRTFSQQAATHISGNYGKPVGCPYCATHGFSLGRNGSIYVLYEETLGLTKVGVTHQPVHRRVMQIRANSLRKYNVDINFKLLQSWEMSGEECSRVEKGAHKYLSERFESPAINFDGSTECFKCSPENAINFIKNF